MNLLEGLLGGGQAAQHQDFVNRYQEGGDPSSGYSMQEAMQRFHQFAPHLSPDQFQQAAQQSFTNMSPEQRAQFGQFLGGAAQQHGINVPGLAGLLGGGGGQAQNPDYLTQITSNLHQQGLLGQLLGGAMGGAQSGFSSGFGSGGVQGGVQGGLQGALGGAMGSVGGGGGIDNMAGGMASNAAENAVGNLGGMFNTPGVKAAVGGIAASAIQQLLHQHGIH
jgi:hypothetical protein